MGNLTKTTIIRSAVVALVLSAGIATTTNAEVTRLSGANRYATSDAIVKAGWPTGAATAVLASGLDANTVDALTVAPLAKAKNAPVVLVNPKDSVPNIVAKFKALNTKTVYIANGTGVISTQVDASLRNAGIANVYRLGGATRYETALNIAKYLGESDSIVVANGENTHLVDSLSIAPIAAVKGMPIFLAGSSLDAATTNYIKGLGAKTTYVLGGTSVVSDEVVKALPGVNRLAGSGRYETNAKIVTNFKTNAALKLNNIFIASGEDANLIDALAGAPLAASKGAPIIFLHHTINPAVNTLLRSIVNGTTKITELGGIGAVTAEADDVINKIHKGVVTFSDKNLEQAIRNTMNKPKGDILKSDVEKVKKLNSKGKNIVSLEGIERLTNLTELSLDNNQIKDIEPLKTLANLTYLDLNSNLIKDIEPLRTLTNLTYLNLSHNNSRNIEPLKALTQLTQLYLCENEISNIEPLMGLTKLTSLNLYVNPISNIEPLKALTKLVCLDLTSTETSNIESLKPLTKLTWLNLQYNKISNIETLKALTNLTHLSLQYNEVSNIEPLKPLAKLTSLDLNCNQISNIEPLKKLTKLISLNLYENQVTNIETLKALTKLTYLDLNSNQISNIEPLKKLTKLTWLNLASNKVSNLRPLKGLTDLTQLNLQHNKISNIEPLRALTDLTQLYLSNNKIKNYSPVSSYYNKLQHKDFTM